MKYFVLWRLKEDSLLAFSCSMNYVKAMRNLGKALKNISISSFRDADGNDIRMLDRIVNESHQKVFATLKKAVITLIQGLYDERTELDKDIWHAFLIPGVKLSAAVKRQKPSMSFEDIPIYYRESVKRYMKSL